jgi:cell division protein FtsL
MTATKTTIALGVLAVATTFTALYQTQQARAVIASLDASRADLAALRREWTDLAAKTKAGEEALAAASAAAPAAARAAARQTGPNQAADPAALEKQKTDRALQEFLAADPELQELKREDRLQRAIRLLLPFGLSLGLTPEELAQVAAEFNRWGPVYLPIDSSHLAGMPQRLAGDPRFLAAWQISDTRFAVENFNMSLWEPLNATQAGRLIQSIQAARPNPIPPDGYNALGVQRTADWARVLAEAGDYLSPSQMSALRGYAAVARNHALLSIAAKPSPR